MATVLKLKALKRALPGAIFMGTPWTDETKTGDTYFLNAEVDNTLGRYEGLIEDAPSCMRARPTSRSSSSRPCTAT